MNLKGRFSWLPEDIETHIEAGRQRYQDIRQGKTARTFAEETEIKAGLAFQDDRGYIIYDYAKLCDRDRKNKASRYHVQEPLDALIEAAAAREVEGGAMR